MSEPVTNAEVEDVLSSIRRLVSEDKRPKSANPPKNDTPDRLVLTPAHRVEEPSETESEDPMPAPAARSDQDTMEDAARQLFDPSDDMPSDVYERTLVQEIDHSEDDTAPEEMEETSAAPEPAPEQHADPAADYSDDPYDFDDDEEVVTPGAEAAEVEVASTDTEAADEAEETPEMEVSADNDMFDFDVLKSRSRDTAVIPEVEATAEADPDPETAGEDGPADTTADSADASEEDRHAGMVAASKAATLSAKIAALETAIGNIADTWEPDTPGTDDYSGTDQPAMAWEDDVSHDATGVPLRGETITASWQEEHPDVIMIGTARAAAAAAAARDGHAPAPEATPEPARPAPSDDQAAKDRAIAAARAAAAERLAADRRAAEHHEATQAREEATPADHLSQQAAQGESAASAPVEAGTPASGSGLDDVDEGQVIDEEALRDLVSDIVRAELQGALGERITRNVRRLVRREIHRALTAQELE